MTPNVPTPESLTFSELAIRWGYSSEYLHDLIRGGRIVPSIALSDQERYVGGEFTGGYFVGDVDNARHQSFAEYFVGTNPEKENFHENRPRCDRIVFCHHAEDSSDGDYSFQFVSKSSSGETAEWYYLDHGAIINGKDGERRFRFLWPDIHRFEQQDTKTRTDALQSTIKEDAAAQSVTSNFASEPASIRRNALQNREHILGSEIERAKQAVTGPENVHSVWTELVKLAIDEVGSLLGMDGASVRYSKSDSTVGLFTKKALKERMARSRKNTEAR